MELGIKLGVPAGNPLIEGWTMGIEMSFGMEKWGRAFCLSMRPLFLDADNRFDGHRSILDER